MGNLHAKQQASFKQRPPEVVRRAGRYYAKDVDGYSKIRTVRPGDIKSTKLDHDLLKAIMDSISSDGKINAQDTKNIILPCVMDGRWGRAELTCNERWTLRYGLGEFSWEYEARQLIFESMQKMHVLDTAGKSIKDKDDIGRVLSGPPLDELEKPALKRARTAKGSSWRKDAFVYVDGMYLDREMLLAAKRGHADDGVVDALEAVRIFKAAADDDDVLTQCERWTFRFILSSHTFTDAAVNFLKEALQKLNQDDSCTA